MPRKSQPKSQSKPQKDTIKRVMHEFKKGELRSRGSGPKVRNPRQAVAIALHEAGASNQESPEANRENLRKTKARERRGEAAGTKASRKTASPKQRLGRQISGRQISGRQVSGRQVSKIARSRSRAELYAEAKRRNIPGRSQMSKADLERALSR